MTTEQVEESIGVGELLRNGEVVRRVRYRIAVHQPTLGPGGLPVPSLRRIEGELDFDGPQLPSDLVGAERSLRLDDGRRLGITVKDGEGRFESCRHWIGGGCGCC